MTKFTLTTYLGQGVECTALGCQALSRRPRVPLQLMLRVTQHVPWGLMGHLVSHVTTMEGSQNRPLTSVAHSPSPHSPIVLVEGK